MTSSTVLTVEESRTSGRRGLAQPARRDSMSAISRVHHLICFSVNVVFEAPSHRSYPRAHRNIGSSARVAAPLYRQSRHPSPPSPPPPPSPGLQGGVGCWVGLLPRISVGRGEGWV